MINKDKNKIRHRRYQAGDEKQINELYFHVTGRQRSIEQFRWQWLNAPGGQGEIWLIEYEQPNGEVLLVGHHGVMPLRFSAGNLDLLVGKTENTMVLPAYRKKILYTRFEQRFLHEYESRFDATFSTMGPPAAIRLREALGYSAKHYWITNEWLIRAAAPLDFFASKVRSKHCYLATILNQTSKVFPKVSTKSQKHVLQLTELTSEQAPVSSFFDDFWETARSGYSIAPRRDKADLKWRFWDNPNINYFTLISENNSIGDAYAVLSEIDENIYQLDDFVCSPNSLELRSAMLVSVSNWVGDRGGSILKFVTTSDSTDQVVGGGGLRDLNSCFPFSLRESPKQYMPRRLCKNSQHYAKIRGMAWAVTPYLFQGA